MARSTPHFDSYKIQRHHKSTTEPLTEKPDQTRHLQPDQTRHLRPDRTSALATEPRHQPNCSISTPSSTDPDSASETSSRQRERSSGLHGSILIATGPVPENCSSTLKKTQQVHRPLTGHIFKAARTFYDSATAATDSTRPTPRELPTFFYGKPKSTASATTGASSGHLLTTSTASR